jgi:hypothetical protein
MIGGMVVGALLSYTSTTLRAKASLDKSIKGIYDADAGIENVLWCFTHGVSPNGTLPKTLNGNDVYMEVEEIGECTLYAGEWITLDTHSDWILVEGNIEYDDVEEKYKYTITVTWNAESGSIIHLSEVGAKLPMDYEYHEESASLFVDNLSDDEPETEYDFDGAQLVKWVLSPPRPSVTESEPVQTQEFYIDGYGDIENHYSWLVAARDDIGYVSELTGTFYVITSTALSSEDGEVVARIRANVMESGGNVYIIAWEINPD